MADVRAPHVGEAERVRDLTRLWFAGTVVQHECPGATGVGVDELEYPGPGVAENVYWLAADRQKDVHSRPGPRLPGPGPLHVLGQVEAASGEVHRQAHGLVPEEEQGVCSERERDGITDLEPRLSGDHAE